MAAATLTAEPATLEGELCPKVVQFTCTIEDLPFLRWFINGTQFTSYIYSDGDTYPLTLPSLPSLPGIGINITSAAPDSSNTDIIGAAMSTLTTNTTLLQGFNIQNFSCGSNEIQSAVIVNFNILGRSIQRP